MSDRPWRLCLTLLLALFATVGSANEFDWGDSRRALRTSLSLAGPARMLGACVVQPHLQRTAGDPWPLASLEEATAYFVITQERRVWYTAPLQLTTSPETPPALAASAVASFASIDLGPLTVRPYLEGMSTEKGYPVGGTDTEGQPLSMLLRHGNALVALVIWLPGGSKGVLLRSNSLSIQILPPSLDELAPAHRDAFLASAIGGFRQDAGAAKRAHALVTASGEPLLPSLLALFREQELGEHGRMWLANALADLGGEAAGQLLAEHLPEASTGVAFVIAFHGPKARHAPLDDAIIAAAVSPQADPLLIAWALRGFSSFHDAIPLALLDSAMAHENPRLRATALDAIVVRPPEDAASRLLRFLGDAHPRINSTAATACARLQVDDRRHLAAMIGLLPDANAEARARICEALSTLTGASHPCPEDATVEVQQAAIEAWQSWLREAE